MNNRILVLTAVALAVLFSSCRPIGAPPTKEKPPVTKLTPEEEAKKKEEERLKAEEELKKKEAEEAAKNQELPPVEPPSNTSANTPRSDYPFANKVPGKDGFVFSPYNNKVIEVRDDQGRMIASGTLVADPTYPPAEKKYFRVP